MTSQKSGSTTIQSILKKNTVRSYEFTKSHFCELFGETDIFDLTSEAVLKFLNDLTVNNKPYTKRVRFSQLTAFFNFVRNNIDNSFINPCEAQMIQNLFRKKTSSRFDIIEKETMDEIIFRTTDIRNRLILELMARGGMRIGEVLKLTMTDIEDRKLILREPKSGEEFETVFIPQRVADRLRIYASNICNKPDDLIFPLSYETVRRMVMKSGKMVGIQLRPHDLRRHSATYASRSGVPIEIVSKVILRHANLSTTQRYLGTISDDEAKRWIEQIYR